MPCRLALRIGLLAVCGVSAATGSSASKPVFAPQPTGASPYRPSLAAEDGAAAAFRVAFRTAEDSVEKTIGGDTYVFKPIALIGLGGGRYALLSGGHLLDPYHGSEGRNAIHYLDRRTSGYHIRGAWFDLGALGESGDPAEHWAVARVRGLAPVLYTDGSSTYMGCSSGDAVLTELTRARPINVASVPILFSDESLSFRTGPATSYRGEIVALDRRLLTIRYTGTRPKTVHYGRHGQAYARSGPAQNWPGC